MAHETQDKQFNYELWRLNRVCKYVGLSKSTIYLMIKSGKFPAPIKISTRAVAWRSDQITGWINSRSHSF